MVRVTLKENIQGDLMQPKLSILVITKDRFGEIIKLLKSIASLEGICKKEIEIKILDNGSREKFNYTEILSVIQRKLFVEVELLFSHKNLGLTEGRNFLAKRALGEWLFFIDDDAFIPESDFYQKFKNYIQNANHVLAAIACNIIEYYKPWKNLYPFSKWKLKKIDTKKPIKCSYFLGGAHFIKRNVFLELGGYDNRLFFWGEELDISYRIINRGWEIHYVPDLLIIHKASENNLIEEKKRDILFLRNKFYLNWKYLPWYFRYISNSIWILNYLKNPLNFRKVAKAFIESRKMTKGAQKEPLTPSALKYLLKNYGRLLY